MKKFFAILLILLLSASLLVACTDNDDPSNTSTNSDSSGAPDNTPATTDKYNYDMTQYVTLADYISYPFNISLDAIQAQIDSYLMDYATEYVVTKGDDIYVNIQAYEVKYFASNDGTLYDVRGEEITELAKTDYLIESIGNGSYEPTLENTIIGTKIGTRTALKLTLSSSFDNSSWAGKEVYIYITVKSKECKASEVALVSYEGYLLDEEGNRADKFDSSASAKFFLGTHLAIDDFEANIIGMLVGETKAFKATFPNDYYEESLRGETVEFEVTVKSIYTPPVYNNEFVSAHFDFETTDAFEKDLKESMVLTEIFDYILNHTGILGYPEKELQKELKALADMEESFAASYDMSLDQYLLQVYGTTREEYVKSNMKSDMIYYSIVKKENIQIKQAHIDAQRQELVEYYTKYYISNVGLSESQAKEKAELFVTELGSEYLYENALFDLVDNFLINNARVTYLDKTYTSVTETK